MNNEFYYKLLNIGKEDVDIEDKLVDIIRDVVKDARRGNNDLVGLCKVVATNISFELDKNKIDYRVISLIDYNLYDHEFIIARTMKDKNMEYYLIDPTFSQFRGYYPFKNLEELNKVMLNDFLKKGYFKINNNDYNNYFKSFGYDGRELDIDSVFLEFRRKKQI